MPQDLLKPEIPPVVQVSRQWLKLGRWLDIWRWFGGDKVETAKQFSPPNMPEINFAAGNPPIWSASPAVDLASPVTVGAPIVPSTQVAPPVAPRAAVVPQSPVQISSAQLAAQKLFTESQKKLAGAQRLRAEKKTWRAHNMVQANLVKDEIVVFLDWQEKILWLIFFVVSSCLLLVSAYGYMLLSQREHDKNNQPVIDNIALLDTQIADAEKKAQAIGEFANQLSFVAYVLDNHIYWTNFFSFLDSHTIKDVYYEGFTGDLTGNYDLKTLAKAYSSIDTERRLLQSSPLTVKLEAEGGTSLRRVGDTTDIVSLILHWQIDRNLFLTK